MRLRLRPVVRVRFGSLTAYRTLVWVLAIGWVAFNGLVLWPAWQARAEAVTTLAEREQELADRLQISASLPITRARLEEHRLAVAGKEAALAEAAADTEIIRLIEQLAGHEVSVTTLLAGQRSVLQLRPQAQESPTDQSRNSAESRGPTQSAQAGQAAQPAQAQPLYWQLSCRVEATGPWEPLRAFVAALEGQVPGLRLHAVQLQEAAETEHWRLVVSGSLYMTGE